MNVTAPNDPGRVRIMHIGEAADLYLAECARQGRSVRTRDTYRRHLYKLDEMFTNYDVDEVTPIMLRRFLDQWQDRKPATSAQIVSVLKSFFDWLDSEDLIDHSPAARLARPRFGRYEERDDLISISTTEVQKLLAAAVTWPERLALHLLAYTGARRHAVAQLRLRDYDHERGEITFLEKGGKTIRKPIPGELQQLLVAAIHAGVYETLDDYLIPSEAEQRRDGDRDDKIVWKLVKRVAARAGIDAHVHAFRAAFAVYFLERKPDKLIALQSLLGHSNLETTRIYLRRLDRRRAMEEVRDLDWSTRPFEASRSTEKEGFEPSMEVNPRPEPQGTLPDALDPIRLKLDELRSESAEKRGAGR